MEHAQERRASPWPFVGIGGLAAVLFLDLASISFLAWWTVVLLVLLWVALFAQACRWFTRRPQRTAVLALVAAAAYALAVGLTAAF